MKKNGIYGYWDTKKECVVYIGKDSNISINKRHKEHHRHSQYDKQQINRVLQNNKERYTYFILCDGYFTEEELNELEEEAIAIFDTYYGYGNYFSHEISGKYFYRILHQLLFFFFHNDVLKIHLSALKVTRIHYLLNSNLVALI